jgi:peptidoglycan-associated lipoprotein
MKAANLTLTAVIGLVLVSMGCKNKDEPQTAPPTSVGSGGETEEKQVDDEPEKAKVHIDPRIQELCGIAADQANFDFDSAKLSKPAKTTLDALADCFLTGPGVGKNMNLVGHADPRGTEDYNFALGQKRAGSVGGYLKKKGLGKERAATSSRGELDATGTDEAGWAADRRVDIMLAE